MKKTKRATTKATKSAKRTSSRRAPRPARKAPPRTRPPAVPPGFQTVTPHLAITGAARAIDFYKRAFGAKERSRMLGPDGSTVMHAELLIGNSIVFVADEYPSMGCRSPKTLGGSTGSLHLFVPNVDQAFARAVAAGAEVRMPVADMFWGDRYAKVADPFGHEWGLASRKEDLTPKQIAERGREFLSRMREGQEVARLAILDWWAVTVAGAAEPVARRLGEALTEETGPASVLGTPRRVAPVTAALLNGTASHALDYDDTHVDLPGHLTAPIFPGLVALAETRRRSGQDVLTAFAVGAEVMCRLARALGRGHYRLGWHATATLGRLGAALAAGRLTGLGAAGLDQAFGLAAAQLGGIQESFGTMAKPFQVGRAASDGLLAALLAECGVTGSAGLLDRESWVRRLSPEWQPEALVDRLGEHWRFTEVFFKRYPCCFAIHAVIRALLSVAPRPALATIESVDLEVGPTTLQVANQVAPRTGLAGKFSVTYCAAVALARGRVAERDFADAAMVDAEIHALAARVRLHARSDLDETRARVVVHLEGGGVRDASADLRLDADPVALRRDLVRKFRELVEPRLGREGAAALEARLERIGEEDDLGKLASLSAVRVPGDLGRSSRPAPAGTGRRSGTGRPGTGATPAAGGGRLGRSGRSGR